MTSWDSNKKKGGSYLGYGAANEYEFEPGVFALPIAIDEADLEDGESPVVIVKAHAAFRTRTLAFDAKKSGTPPILPEAANTGAFVFLGGSVLIPQPAMDSSLVSHIWQGSGVYEFVENVRSSTADGFVLMSFPFLTATEADILENGGGSTGGSTGAISVAGQYAKAGYEQSQQISFDSGYYGYNIPSYWPGTFFNDQLANGGSPG